MKRTKRPPKPKPSGASLPRDERKQVLFQCHLSPEVYDILILLVEKRSAYRSRVIQDALVLLATQELGRKLP